MSVKYTKKFKYCVTVLVHLSGKLIVESKLSTILLSNCRSPKMREFRYTHIHPLTSKKKTKKKTNSHNSFIYYLLPYFSSLSPTFDKI